MLVADSAHAAQPAVPACLPCVCVYFRKCGNCVHLDFSRGARHKASAEQLSVCLGGSSCTSAGIFTGSRLSLTLPHSSLLHRGAPIKEPLPVLLLMLHSFSSSGNGGSSFFLQKNWADGRVDHYSISLP